MSTNQCTLANGKGFHVVCFPMLL